MTGFEKDAPCAAVAGEICAYEAMDDPRVSGEVRLRVDMDCSPETAAGDFCWMGGDIVITNEGGTWDGRWVGIRWLDGLHEMTGWYRGTGAYEGWSYIAVVSTDVVPPEPSVLTRSRGVLVHGDLPPSVDLGG